MADAGPARVVAGPPHGPHASLTLENKRLRVVVVPPLGAKVVSLVDRATGREWLTRGRPREAGDSPDAIFGASAAYGWDECVPTVAPGPDPLVAGGRLRDHGDAWGRPAELTVLDAAIETATDGLAWPYLFRRRLRLEGPAIVADYTIVSREPAGGRALPLLWSMHPLLDLEPGARIWLPADVGEVALSHAAGVATKSAAGAPRRVPWPGGGRGSRRLDEVGPTDAAEALKLYAGPLSEGRAAVETADGSSLTLSWDVAALPFLGLWLDYGGWPSDRPLHQVGLEPTTAPSDELSGAIAADRAWWVTPGGHIEWTVRIEVRGG